MKICKQVCQYKGYLIDKEDDRLSSESKVKFYLEDLGKTSGRFSAELSVADTQRCNRW